MQVDAAAAALQAAHLPCSTHCSSTRHVSSRLTAFCGEAALRPDTPGQWMSIRSRKPKTCRLASTAARARSVPCCKAAHAIAATIAHQDCCPCLRCASLQGRMCIFQGRSILSVYASSSVSCSAAAQARCWPGSTRKPLSACWVSVLPGHPTWKGATLEVMKTSSRLSPASRMPAATSASFCAAPNLVKHMHPNKGHCTGCTWEETSSAIPDRVTLCRSLLSLHGGLLERLSSRRRRLQGTFPAQGCNDARTELATKCCYILQVTVARVATVVCTWIFNSSVMRTSASWRRCSGPLY